MTQFRHSDLDTEVFGYPIARADLDVIDDISGLFDYAHKISAPLMVARCDSTSTELKKTLRTTGFRWVETQIKYQVEPGTSPGAELRATLPLRPFRSFDQPQLIALARQTFARYPTHYLRDPRLNRGAVQRLYESWALNACRDTSHHAYVAEREGAILGFGIVKIDDKGIGQTVLAGVKYDAFIPPNRILWDLSVRGLQIFHEFGATTATTVTQASNRVSREFFSTIGAREVSKRDTFHKWL